ncbi:Uncharacterised protein [Candidatus Anstonella stagnisolia]|nr:Uncharacterised protein [Candidatus Anstonella stagnisolia]
MQPLAYSPPNMDAHLRQTNGTRLRLEEKLQTNLKMLDTVLTFYPTLIVRITELAILAGELGNIGGRGSAGLAHDPAIKKHDYDIGRVVAALFENTPSELERTIEMKQGISDKCEEILSLLLETNACASKLKENNFALPALNEFNSFPQASAELEIVVRPNLEWIINKYMPGSIAASRLALDGPKARYLPSGKKPRARDVKADKLARQSSGKSERYNEVILSLGVAFGFAKTANRDLIGKLNEKYPGYINKFDVETLPEMAQLMSSKEIFAACKLYISTIQRFIRAIEADEETKFPSIQSLMEEIARAEEAAGRNIQTQPNQVCVQLRGALQMPEPIAKTGPREKEILDGQLRGELSGLGCNETEINELLGMNVLKNLKLVRLEDAVAYYRKKTNEGKPPSRIANQLAKIDRFRAECSEIVSGILGAAGFHPQSANAVARQCIDAIAKKEPRLIHADTIGKAMGNLGEGDVVEILCEASETSADVKAKLDDYYALLGKTVSSLQSKSVVASDARRTLRFPDEITASAQEWKAEPDYIVAILSSFHAGGAKSVPAGALEKRARHHVVQDLGVPWSASKFRQAEKFLSGIGIIEGHASDSQRLVTSGSSVQNPVASALLPSIREFYQASTPNNGSGSQ